MSARRGYRGRPIQHAVVRCRTGAAGDWRSQRSCHRPGCRSAGSISALRGRRGARMSRRRRRGAVYSRAPGGQGGQSLRISLDTPNAVPAELHPAPPMPVVVEPDDRPDTPGEAGAGATVIGFASVKALPPACPATVGAVMLVGLRPAVGSTGTVAMFGDLPSCSETAGPTPIVPVVGVPSAFAVPPALGTAAGNCVEGAVVAPIGCALDDATVKAIRPAVTRVTTLLLMFEVLFMFEVLQIRSKETELDSDWFGLAAWLPIAASARLAVDLAPPGPDPTVAQLGSEVQRWNQQFAQAVRPTDPIVAQRSRPFESTAAGYPSRECSPRAE
jgi:hypothetical protein